MIYTITWDNINYNIIFTLINGNKIAPLERVFKEIFIKTLNECQYKIDETITNFNRNNLNIKIQSITVINNEI